jgi:outer membrane PBP1 activator LpoA protein
LAPKKRFQRLQSRADREDRWKITIARLLVAQGKMDQAVKTLEQVTAKTSDCSRRTGKRHFASAAPSTDGSRRADVRLQVLT